MPLQRLILVLPCYSLEDLPRSLDAETAADFHACWTALWHPSFLLNLVGLPEWKRSDSSSLDVSAALILLPKASEEHLDTTIRERLVVSDNILIHSAGTRQANVDQIASVLEVQTVDRVLEPQREEEQGDGAKRSPITASSFYALGFAYQQLHILTRKVHYSTNLDVALFHEQLLKAAQAFVDSQADETEKWLQSCFDQISQERDRYFSQQAHLIDLTLLADTTLGISLDAQLQRVYPQNILASADMLRRLHHSNERLFSQLAERVTAANVSIIGGLDREGPHPWLPVGTLIRDLYRGLMVYQTLGFAAPAAFARLTGGIFSNDSQFFTLAGYKFGVLSAWLNGTVPRSEQAKVRWQSADGSTLDTLAAFVVDANSALSVLSIAVDLAKQFDYHQVPTVLLAHWPNQYCEAFEDLTQASQRTSALGKWTTLGNYFEQTGQAYSNTVLPTSQFRFPIPSRRDRFIDFSSAVRVHRHSITQAESAASLSAFNFQIADWLGQRKSMQTALTQADEANQDLQACDAAASIALSQFVDPIACAASGWKANEMGIRVNQTGTTQQAADLLATLLSGAPVPTAVQPTSENSDKPVGQQARWLDVKPSVTTMLINLAAAPQRYFLRTGSTAIHCGDSERVYAAENSASGEKLLQSELFEVPAGSKIGGHEVIVDVPAMGALQISAATSGTSKIGGAGTKRSMIALSAKSLSNEFIDVQIDPASGQLRSLLVARKRGSRMSGQLSIANPGRETVADSNDSGAASGYASTQDVRLSIEHNSSLSAIVKAQGIFVWNKSIIASFTILYELWRGSRSLQITPSIKWASEPSSDQTSLWDAAPVWRSAWSSEAASLRLWQHEIPIKAASASIFCDDMLEVDDAEHKLHLLWSGPCFHRRQEGRYLDTHLGSGTGNRILVGLDLPEPLQAYQAWTQPIIIGNSPMPLSANQHSASFLSGSRRGLSIRWLPENQIEIGRDGQAVDATSPKRALLWIQENNGKSGTAALSFFRDVAAAEKVDLRGQTLEKLDVLESTVQLPLKSSESVLLRVHWS